MRCLSVLDLVTHLRGCRSLLEIFVYFICLFFSLAAKLKRSANGASIL